MRSSAKTCGPTQRPDDGSGGRRRPDALAVDRHCRRLGPAREGFRLSEWFPPATVSTKLILFTPFSRKRLAVASLTARLFVVRFCMCPQRLEPEHADIARITHRL